MIRTADPALREMKEQARLNVLENYDWNSVLDALTDVPAISDEDNNGMHPAKYIHAGNSAV